ncbi:1-deoxy-D-xylulose-5-phosphate reductoisomerase [Kordiimonas aquimaris]|uniref:1-deoxy-D-xylulose-5-phosphate reductoisomerase n=1 Tax=Kordiimonas aquimaris TaxID=707591 RepID=UPI0021CFC432|nr:1-deoxy-D-xylulose-5-phosphate reductoisomerase [Kordiimonas aquimaris]
MSTVKPRRITVLGATGSIGMSTLDLVRRNPDKFIISALTANSNAQALAKLAIEFNAELAVVADPKQYRLLKELLAGTAIQIAVGEEGLIQAATLNADFVMSAIVGAAGLRPTLSAIRCGTTIGLANKESLVCAGDIMMQEAITHKTKIMPVDSEHNAIFQVFDNAENNSVEKIILTASGGPFLGRDQKSLKNVTPSEAIKHPNWEMGQKISIDSATMMNKGLEVIEAFHLFPVSTKQIEVLVHPQSVIHSMVQYVDGSVLAQLGSPDMRTPIAYSLAWPERMHAPVDRLSLAEIGQLSFFTPDLEAFPCLRLATEALHAGGSASIVLNAANEIAVEAFLNKKISFTDISSVVQEVLGKNDMKAPHSLSMVFEIDENARRNAENTILNSFL